MTVPESSTIGTIQRVNESVRRVTNLHERGIITAREAVRHVIGDMRLLEAELVAAKEAEGLDEALAKILGGES